MKILYNLRLVLLFSFFLILCKINLSAASYFFTYDGHTYEIVDQKKTWTDAASYATSKGGYLVHIESSGEQNAIWSAITSGAQIPMTYTVVNDGGGIAYIWIGATDKSTEGKWLWDGDNDNEGINFWQGQGSAGKNDGKVINELYNNWGGSSVGNPKEPDDFGSNQDAAAIAMEAWPKNMGILGKSGEWNDISINNQIYFIVEYDYIESSLEESIKRKDIFPNPAIDFINIENIKMGNYNTCKIYDILGNLLIIDELIINENSIIDIRKLDPGFYILILSNNETSFHTTFIKN